MLSLRLPGLVSIPRSAAFAVSHAPTLDFMAYLKDAYLMLEMVLKVDIVVTFGNGMAWNYNSVVLREPGLRLLSRPIRKTARWSAGDEYCPDFSGFRSSDIVSLPFRATLLNRGLVDRGTASQFLEAEPRGANRL